MLKRPPFRLSTETTLPPVLKIRPFIREGMFILLAHPLLLLMGERMGSLHRCFMPQLLVLRLGVTRMTLALALAAIKLVRTTADAWERKGRWVL